jgi:hypothetical protein
MASAVFDQSAAGATGLRPAAHPDRDHGSDSSQLVDITALNNSYRKIMQTIKPTSVSNRTSIRTWLVVSGVSALAGAALALAVYTRFLGPGVQEMMAPQLPVQHPTTYYCDPYDKQPVVPAAQCGGVDSCTRMALNHLQPTPCPTP